MMQVDLGLARNMFGPLDASIRQRLQAMLDCPCEEHWDDTHGIILTEAEPRVSTLWQWVLMVDPTFPRRGPSETLDGRRLSGWARIPDRELVAQAINMATH